jgi:hypothetical protein
MMARLRQLARSDGGLWLIEAPVLALVAFGFARYLDVALRRTCR